MNRKRKRRHAYRPSDNRISPISMISIGTGIIGILLYVVVIQLSVKHQGNIGVAYGMIPWLVLFAAILGEYLAYQSLKDTVTVAKWKILGGVTNGILIVFSLVVFFRGLF